jgi:hypothetical protein
MVITMTDCSVIGWGANAVCSVPQPADCSVMGWGANAMCVASQAVASAGADYGVLIFGIGLFIYIAWIIIKLFGGNNKTKTSTQEGIGGKS